MNPRKYNVLQINHFLRHPMTRKRYLIRIAARRYLTRITADLSPLRRGWLWLWNRPPAEFLVAAISVPILGTLLAALMYLFSEPLFFLALIACPVFLVLAIARFVALWLQK